jgi:signal transduction histidine kinase
LKKEVNITIIIIAVTTASLVVLILVYTDIDAKRLDDSITVTKADRIALISSQFELEINDLVNIMELTSHRPIIMQPPVHADLISEQLRGIPKNIELEKRNVAQEILNKTHGLEYVFYAMPNGDIYFLEPYELQISLPVSNFAFRDWYKGATSTHETYISEGYVSAATFHNVVAMAIPIYNTNSGNKSLNGIWAAALNLNTFQTNLAKMNHGAGEYFLIADHNNNIMIDSRQSQNKKVLETIPWNLKEKSNGDVTNTIETINNTKMLVTVKSMPIGTHRWTILSIEPTDEAFFSSITLRGDTYVIISILILISSGSGFFTVRQTNKNVILSKKLETTNLLLTQQAEKLRQLDITKEEFSAMVTHELKTPLVPILGYCKMLKTSMLGKLNEEETNAIEVIEKNTKALEQLITDIMDIRKLDIGKMKFHLENFHVNELFDDLDSSYKKILKNRGIEFVTKLSVKDISIHADKARLRQVFDNLIGNSIKFVSENNGLIEVGGYKGTNSLILYVKDNGIGIPKDKQSDLFKKFYQIDTSLTRSIGGTGLGLAISKGIMEKLGGDIWVESDGKTGTTLYLKLPL